MYVLDCLPSREGMPIVLAQCQHCHMHIIIPLGFHSAVLALDFQCYAPFAKSEAQNAIMMCCAGRDDMWFMWIHVQACAHLELV